MPAPLGASGPDGSYTDEPDALTDALARCYSHLARREHSVAELREKLARAVVGEETIERALAVVIEQGYLNDERYARLLAEDRRSLDGWGVVRIRDRMMRAGIDASLIDATLASFDEASECEAAVALLRRRFPSPPGDARVRQRAFGLLVRQGFDSDIAYAAIRKYEGEHGGSGDLQLAS